MNAMAIPTKAGRFPRLQKLWRERVVGLIVAQFTQGITPQKIALTIALGVNLAMFPVLGSTTFLCAIFGVSFRLNQPVIQLVNWLSYPLQLTMLLPFVRMGEWMMGAQSVSFSIPELIQKFDHSPAQFMREFGMTGVHGIVAWLVTVPFTMTLIFFVLLPPLKKLSQLSRSKTHE